MQSCKERLPDCATGSVSPEAATADAASQNEPCPPEPDVTTKNGKQMRGYQCPFCQQHVNSTIETGQIDHRYACGKKVPCRWRQCHRPHAQARMPNLRNNCSLRTRKGPNQSDAQKHCWTNMPPGKLVRDDTATLTTTANCQLPTCLRCLAAGSCAARLRSRDLLAGLKHHGSEGRSGPAAGSPD